MQDVRKLVYALIKFLKAQHTDGGLSSEGAEGVEVAIQCLETAYNISGVDPSLEVPFDLQETFQKFLTEYESLLEATPEEKAAAEVLKNEGNMFMTAQNYRDALACYSKAIRLDQKNAVYYCNRAAAHNKLGNFESVIMDCTTALKFDPFYSKAYGRLGLAHANLNKHEEAVNCYKKALELEPDNESYKANLKLAQEVAAKSTTAAPSMSFNNRDLTMIFTNPNLLSMATQMLSNPSMQNMMSGILAGNLNPRGSGVDVLLQASQQLADQMENENPALINQMRQQFESGSSGSSGGSPPENPPSSQ